MRRKHRLGAPPFMPVKLQLDPRRLWSWHRAMVDHLRTVTGSNVYVEMAPPGASLPFAIGRILSLERSVASESHPAFIQLAVPDFAAKAGETADRHECVVDLAAEGLPPVAKPPMPQRQTFLPLYDGAPGEAAMWAAILSGRAPRLDLYDTATGRILTIGQPAIEAPHSASAGAAAVVVRLIEGIGHALAGRLEAADPAEGEPGKSPTMAAAGLLARKIASKARRMKERMLADAPQWAVAWTCREEPAPRNRERLDPREYNLLADDGQRYYADPFLFAHEGEVFCFVEELPYATGRGLISVTTLSPDGRAATPWPILETPCHLSYPQVFARDGEIYMLPEQHQSGALVLYRAARFPSVWEPAGVLIDEPLHDATLFEQGGRLWIAATAQGPDFGAVMKSPASDGTGSGWRQKSVWGSSWDALSLYSAETLMGPWTPHQGNPVLIDAAAARPAGPTFTIEGGLYRPVQDCRTGYGAALNIARIDRLDDGGYRQTVVAQQRFAGGTMLDGPHQISRLTAPAGHFEAVDVFATRRRMLAHFAARDRKSGH